MRRSIYKAVLFVLLSALGATDAVAREFYLRDGDRVVFYGDSITEGNHYAAFVETYAVTRFPLRRYEFINSGWSGDWVVGGGGGKMPERVRRDIVAHRPTILVAMFGMNDGGYRAFDKSFFDVYVDGYRKLVAELKRTLPNLRVTLLRPSPFDDITESDGEWRITGPKIENGGYNRTLIRYGDFVGELARANNFTVVDVNAPLVSVIEKLKASDPKAASAIIPDRIHPGEVSGLLMAAELLRTWNAPATVTSVEIDARRNSIVRAENTEASALKTGASLSWRQRDAALPLPIDPEHRTMMIAARAANIFADLDRQTLKIAELSGATRYELRIDEQAIGSWTGEELAGGVSLAEFATPMLRQAQRVYDLSVRRARIRFIRWREIQTAFEKRQTPIVRRTVAALNELENEIIDEQRRAAQPVARRYELIPVERHGRLR